VKITIEKTVDNVTPREEARNLNGEDQRIM